MAVAIHSRSAMFFSLAILIYVAASPHAEAGNVTLVKTSVSGRICCSNTGNCLFKCQGLSQVPVQLNCTNFAGVSKNVGQTKTTATGSFNITVGNLTGISGLIPCKVGINLPVNATICPQLSGRNGVVKAVVLPIFTTVVNFTGGAISLSQTAVAGLFSFSPSSSSQNSSPTGTVNE